MANPPLSAEERHYARELRSWRERRGLTKKALALATSYDPSRVSHIEAGRQAPTEEFTRQAESVLKTGGALWECWEAIATARFHLPTRPPERDLRTTDFVDWLADQSGLGFQQTYAAVSSMVARLEASPPSIRHGEDRGRRGTTRAQIAAAVADYYDEPGPGSLYGAVVGDANIRLSILTLSRWLTVTRLGSSAERFRFIPAPSPRPAVDDAAVAAAIRRLACVELTETVLVNNPLYDLIAIESGDNGITASMGLTSFATYALTSDLLEEELLDSLTPSVGRPGTGGQMMPLRATYLPTRSSAMAVDERICVGGPVALTAIARKQRSGTPDYLLLVQERSNSVLNVTGRLAVIPKAFHQPTGEPADEVALSVTLQREFEEELLGRADLEQLATAASSRRVAPLHRHQVSDPLAWLLDPRRAGAFRTECTGLGINMVTGNYEFACLVVIDDESWWDNFGHLVESNWEAQRVHCLSSLDTAGLQQLVTDPRWSNEGLFAFLQGLRRLTDLDTAGRVAAPALHVEI